jgi:hypothetical protein
MGFKGPRLIDSESSFTTSSLINLDYGRAKAMLFVVAFFLTMVLCAVHNGPLCAVDNGTVPSLTHDCLVIVVVAVVDDGTMAQ